MDKDRNRYASEIILIVCRNRCHDYGVWNVYRFEGGSTGSRTGTWIERITQVHCRL